MRWLSMTGGIADDRAVVEHMSTYWAILEKLPGSKLRLTKFDDDILAHFNRDFPDFNLQATINEDDMKSKEGKEPVSYTHLTLPTIYSV